MSSGVWPKSGAERSGRVVTRLFMSSGVWPKRGAERSGRVVLLSQLLEPEAWCCMMMSYKFLSEEIPGVVRYYP